MTSSFIFVCTKNAIRSPMAEALAKSLMQEGKIPMAHVDSAGVDPGDIDGFAIGVMNELGIDLQRHESKDLAAVASGEFDLVIALSDAAAKEVETLIETVDSQLEVWDVPDASLVEGNREARLSAFRDIREALAAKIQQRFPL